jgi:hypothetical protein
MHAVKQWNIIIRYVVVNGNIRYMIRDIMVCGGGVEVRWHGWGYVVGATSVCEPSPPGIMNHAMF